MAEVPAEPRLISNQKSIKWKKVLIIGIVTFLLLLGGAGLWLLLSKPSTSLPSKTPTSTSAEKIATPSAQIDTSNWKTIGGMVNKWQSKEENKFEFKAPEEFKITPREDLSSEWKKYYFSAKGNGITFFAGLMEGPGPLLTLHARAKNELCPKPLELQVLYEGVFEVCDTVQIDDQKALFLIEVSIGSNLHASSCVQNSSLHVIYNLGDSTSLFFRPELDVLKEIIRPWDKIPADAVYTDDKGQRQVCPKDIDFNTVKNNLATKISSIRNGEDLSETDNQTLQTLYQILSTFKFLD